MPNVNMVKLTLPRSVSVHSAPQLVEICSQIKKSSGPIELDCSQVAWIDPLGMTMLVSTLETIDQNRPVSMPWLSSDITSYLERMDFFQNIHVEAVDVPRDRVRNDQKAKLLEIKRLRGRGTSEQIADQLASSIASTIIGRAPKEFSFEEPDVEHLQYYTPLRYALSELIENALTHARRNGRHDASVWVASQCYSSSRVNIAVVDDGCGFLGTLKGHPEMTDNTHASAILTALRIYP